MMRLQLVLALLTLIVIGNIVYRRRMSGLQTVRSGEMLPVELRGPGATWVVFTTPTCVTCGPVLHHLRSSEHGATVTAIDATERPDLSDALAVRAAPTVLRAGRDGVVDLRLAGPAAASQFFSLSTS
jgi:hypothetical protein